MNQLTSRVIIDGKVYAENILKQLGEKKKTTYRHTEWIKGIDFPYDKEVFVEISTGTETHSIPIINAGKRAGVLTNRIKFDTYSIRGTISSGYGGTIGATAEITYFRPKKKKENPVNENGVL